MNKVNIFLTGTGRIPKALKAEKNFQIKVIENPYELRDELTTVTEPAVTVVYLPFLEMRHFDLYTHFQRKHENLQTIFIVNELSANMKLKLKHNKDFIVLWKTEENCLIANIKQALQGKHLMLREEKREQHKVRALLSAAALPTGHSDGFKPMLPGAFGNISANGSCLKIPGSFYEPKDFVNLSYQNKEGEFVNLQGQVRWARWDDKKKIQELGLHFVSSN